MSQSPSGFSSHTSTTPPSPNTTQATTPNSFTSHNGVVTVVQDPNDVLPPKTKTNELLDREERAVAALLTRFKNLVSLAALPTDDAFAKEIAAAEGLRMEVEGNALTSAAEDLLKLTRELKELWIFGPLRDIGEGEGEGAMEEDSKKVEELLATQLQKKHDQEQNKA